MKPITRREFLKNTIKLGGALSCSSLVPALAKEEGLIVPSPVAISKGGDVTKTTNQALALLGGIDKVVKPGQRVFIKPNYIAGGLMGHDPVTSGEIPHPEVVAQVARECVEAGAKEVLIGEWFERPLTILWQGKANKSGAQVKLHIDRINKKFGHKVFLVNLRKITDKLFTHITAFGKCFSKSSFW